MCVYIYIYTHTYACVGTHSHLHMCIYTRRCTLSTHSHTVYLDVFAVYAYAFVSQSAVVKH